jgi:hypothetical protein
MSKSTISIYYTDEENLKVVFSYLIFNVESINKKYGKLSAFVNDFDLYGETNGRLYIISEMVEPHMRLAALINDRVRWTGLKEKEDYVFGYERLIYGVHYSVSSLVYNEIPELKAIEWLGSMITSKGNYVWFHKATDERKDPILTFRENKLEGMPPKKYYQQLLSKHLEHQDVNQLNGPPKVNEVGDYYVFFETGRHKGKNAICRETLERYSSIITDSII